jgi:hypothetical protein
MCVSEQMAKVGEWGRKKSWNCVGCYTNSPIQGCATEQTRDKNHLVKMSVPSPIYQCHGIALLVFR